MAQSRTDLLPVTGLVYHQRSVNLLVSAVGEVSFSQPPSRRRGSAVGTSSYWYCIPSDMEFPHF